MAKKARPNQIKELFDAVMAEDGYEAPKNFADVLNVLGKVVEDEKCIGDQHDNLLEMARLAEHAERYDDMCHAMKELIKHQSNKLGPDLKNFVLSVEARNMLSVAFKNEVGKRRSAYRNLNTEDEEGNMVIVDDNDNGYPCKRSYARSPRQELDDKCNEILDLLAKYLIDNNAKDYWMGLAEDAKKKHPDAKPKDKDNDAEPKGPSAFEVQARRQRHVLLSWMEHTLDEVKSKSKSYPYIHKDQKGDGEVEKLQSFCNKYLKAVTACKNIRSLEDPEDMKSKKEYNKEFGAKGGAFDQLQTSVETLVFYLKMCGDYKRYLAEMMDDPKGDLKKEAIDYYEDAFATAELILQATHPTRLGLSLNMSVCYYEISQDQKKACALAKSAFDLAIQQLDGLSDDNYKDSTLIMQLLRDNLTIWQQDQDKKNPANEIEQED